MAHRRRIHYRHPHYPGQLRTGYVLYTGADGHSVEHCETGREEHVRYKDVVGESPGVEDDDAAGTDQGDDDEGSVADELQKALMPLMDGEYLRHRAARYQDQYAVGHPARLHPDDLDWKLETDFPLAHLPGKREAWLDWHHKSDRGIGYAKQDKRQRVLHPIVAVQGTDGQHYIWDGNHRVAEMHAAGHDTIPAIVGRPKNAKLPLPPGSEGRTGIRKALRPGGLPLFLKATDAYSKIRQKAAATQVMSRLQANAKAGQIGAGAAGRDSFRSGGGKSGGGKQQAGQEWQPATAPPRGYRVGQKVHYQRPDMGQPSIGKIASINQHGAHVTPPQGGLHKVRHEHILGDASMGLPADWRQQGAEALQAQGVPVDKMEQYLLPDREQRPTEMTLQRIQALVKDGAPIDMERVKHASEQDARMIIEYFAGSIDHGDGTMPEPKKGKKPEALADPWKERE